MCRRRAIKAIEVESTTDYHLPHDNHCNYFFGTAKNKQFDINRPMINIYVNDVKIKFRVDTVADVIVISSETFRLFEDAKLPQSSQFN